MTGKRIEIDEETKAFLQSDEVVPLEGIIINSQQYFPKEHVKSGTKGVVWKGRDEYNHPVAIKFTISEDYEDRSYLEEANRASKLRDYPGSFARFDNVGLVELKLPNDQKRRFVCFMEEWIDGWTLESYLQQHEIGGIFLRDYAKGMCEALNILKTLNLRHGDLHQGNVMIAKPKPGTLDTSKLIVKIIDTGSLKPIEAPFESGEKDDIRRFTEHLVSIWNSIRRRKTLSLAERLFLKETMPLLNSMLEEDKAIALWEPAKVWAQFDHTWTRYQYPQEEETIRLQDPFDYIAAEHISSDKLLVNLFAESCPWLKLVSSPDPILLTGPRGCGKSMVFRRLSLKALLYKSAEDVEESQIAGFYVSCSADLRNRFGWLTTERMAHRFHKAIVHYFNLLLTREVLQTLIAVGQRDDRESLFGFGRGEESKVHSFLMEKLGTTETERLRLQGMTPMEHALEIVESEMDQCYKRMIQGVSLGRGTDTTFLSDLTRCLSREIRYFNQRRLTFLVDDFSVHRIPEPVQVVLNPVIWDRQATHVFKLSAEKYGAAVVDILNGTTEATRELREIDCGQFYIDLSDRDLRSASRQFARELLATRLGLAGYEGTPEEILGQSKYEEGSLGKALRTRAEKSGRKDDQYYGLETIADLCSGDISVLLEIYRRIFQEGRVNEQSREMVPKYVQHAAVEAVSRELLNLIKSYVPRGEEMYSIAHWFGHLSRRILREGYLQKKGEYYIPCETSRIEIDQVPGQLGEDWTTGQRELMLELVRRAVFIEMEVGRGRHGFTPTLRWQLRRVYCPTFGTSLAKNTAVKWAPAQFKYFLTNPKEACADEFEKKWQKARQAAPKEQIAFPAEWIASGGSATNEDVEEVS